MFTLLPSPNLLVHIQLTLTRGPDILGSYAVLFFTASRLLSSADTSTVSATSALAQLPQSFLGLLAVVFCPSPVACGHLWPGAQLSVSHLFASSYSSWGDHGKSTGVMWHSPTVYHFFSLYVITLHYIWNFIGKMKKNHGRAFLKITPPLLGYSWSGNSRISGRLRWLEIKLLSWCSGVYISTRIPLSDRSEKMILNM